VFLNPSGVAVDHKDMDNFSINEEKDEDNLVRDFSCALCVGKQAKIRMRQNSANVNQRSHRRAKLPV
jgi:hypothetical protein